MLHYIYKMYQEITIPWRVIEELSHIETQTEQTFVSEVDLVWSDQRFCCF